MKTLRLISDEKEYLVENLPDDIRIASCFDCKFIVLGDKEKKEKNTCSKTDATIWGKEARYCSKFSYKQREDKKK